MLGNNYKRMLSDLVFGIGISLVVIGLFLFFHKEVRIDEGLAQLDHFEDTISLDYSFLSTPIEEIKVTIPRGSSGFTVGNILADCGLIDLQDYRKLLILFDFEDKIKAGEYVFKSDESIAEVLNKIIIRR